jgi:hypothetical protein
MAKWSCDAYSMTPAIMQALLDWLGEHRRCPSWPAPAGLS